MLHHEKSAFLKFFITYFLSVAILILAVGFFYFEQMRGQLIKMEHFSLIEYARHIKMDESIKEFSNDFHNSYVDTHDKHIDIRNFSVGAQEFSKFIPVKDSFTYLRVFKSKNIYNTNLYNLKIKIIIAQILLLTFFAFISYFLARKALKPLRESIQTLDKFGKDLIHDLNTPVGAMKLNIKILEKDDYVKDLKALARLKKSVDTISELRESLTTLLEKKTFQISNINICDVLYDVIELHQPNYPKLSFQITCGTLVVQANENALKQILHNLISNACKYNAKDGFIKIYVEDNKVYIEDNGVQIQDVDKIFTREYSTQNSTGFGLDIVKRLCDSMNIKVDATSSKSGNKFCLKFN